jgi:hypothetical protein
LPFLFKRQVAAALPTTSYGYTPPPEATAHGWERPGDDCGRGGGHEAVPRIRADMVALASAARNVMAYNTQRRINEVLGS